MNVINRGNEVLLEVFHKAEPRENRKAREGKKREKLIENMNSQREKNGGNPRTFFSFPYGMMIIMRPWFVWPNIII